jgi:drug/metabolite transporter (DMT)-like permease
VNNSLHPKGLSGQAGRQNAAILLAVLAAVLYAVNIPLSKMFLANTPPTMVAAFLYIGAGIGMGTMMLARRRTPFKGREANLSRSDLPYTVAMVALDILAPILLMHGLRLATAANASLLNNFEIVATTLLAMLFFHEQVSRRLWLAVVFVTVASILLSVEGEGTWDFSLGSLLVLAATVCWGLENNCTRQIADKDPMEIVTVKGFGSGLGALCVAFVIGEQMPSFEALIGIGVLGFISYGLSIYVYTYAQRVIGAAKTSTYYAIAPFVGSFLSIVFLGEKVGLVFFIALALMAVGAWLAQK